MIYYFADEPIFGDLDNIIKPILDALCQVALGDDDQVDRLVAQRFSRIVPIHLQEAVGPLRTAMEIKGPRLYIKLSEIPPEDPDHAALV